LLIYAVFLRRFKYISIKLDEQGIVYTNIKEQIFIPYEDINMIQFPSIKYMGGWTKIVYSKGSIRLTAVLENIGEFMGELKQKLDERNMMDVYDEDRFFSFYKTGVFADESWERIYGNIATQVITCFVCVIITIVTLVLHGGNENNKLYLYASFIVPILGYLISEIIMVFQVHKRIEEDSYQLLPRNEEFEKNLFKFCNLGAAIVYLVVFFSNILL
ncbi:hypothetical protein, partial [Anaerosporobacter sp.]